MTLSFRVCTSQTDAHELVPQWRALWERVPTATVFQRPEWLLPWWRAFANDDSAWLFTCHVNGELVGLVPCRLRDDEAGGRVLAFLGEAVSDYLDAIIAPDHVSGVVEAFWDAVEQTPDIGVIDLQELAESSPLLTGAPRGWVQRMESHGVCPRLPLPEAITRAADVVPAELAQKLARARRKLERRGAIRFERAEPCTVADHLASFFRLHHSRWDRRGDTSVADAPGVQAFHDDAAPRLASSGMLELWTLSLDGRAVASVYALLDRGCLRFYLGTFDPELSACSPGAVAILHVVEQGIVAGVRELDFLRGREAWKYRWGARDRTNARRILRRR